MYQSQDVFSQQNQVACTFPFLNQGIWGSTVIFTDFSFLAFHSNFFSYALRIGMSRHEIRVSDPQAQESCQVLIWLDWIFYFSCTLKYMSEQKSRSVLISV